MVDRLQLFLERLRLGEFESQLEKAFGELELVVGNSEEGQLFLRNVYLPELYNDGHNGRQHLIYIATEVQNYPVVNVARIIANVLIAIYTNHPEDEEILRIYPPKPPTEGSCERCHDATTCTRYS